MIVIVVRLIGDCDVSPRNFERARGPSQRAGIEDSRDRDPGGYLWDRESSQTEFVRDLPRSATYCGRLLLAEPQPVSGAHQLNHGSENILY